MGSMLGKSTTSVRPWVHNYVSILEPPHDTPRRPQNGRSEYLRYPPEEGSGGYVQNSVQLSNKGFSLRHTWANGVLWPHLTGFLMISRRLRFFALSDKCLNCLDQGTTCGSPPRGFHKCSSITKMVIFQTYSLGKPCSGLPTMTLGSCYPLRPTKIQAPEVCKAR